VHQRIQNWSIWPERFPANRFDDENQTLRRRRSDPQRASDGQRSADPSAMSSLERVELLSELEARHGIEIDEDAFSQRQQPQTWKNSCAPGGSAGFSATAGLAAFASVTNVSRCIPAMRRDSFVRIAAADCYWHRDLVGVDAPVVFAANHSSDLDTAAIFNRCLRHGDGVCAGSARRLFRIQMEVSNSVPLVRIIYNAYPLPQEVAGRSIASISALASLCSAVEPFPKLPPLKPERSWSTLWAGRRSCAERKNWCSSAGPPRSARAV